MKDALKQLNEEQMMKRIAQATEDGVMVLDRDGIIVMMSPAYRRYRGMNDEAAIGQSAEELFGDAGYAEILRGGVSEAELVNNGEGRIMAVSRHPIFDDGQVTGCVERIVRIDRIVRDDLHERMDWMERRLTQYKNELSQMSSVRYTFEEILGEDRRLIKAKEQAKRATGTDSHVMIVGEHGTGKEMFAHAIHQMSGRSEGPFIKVDCSELPEALLETELFGCQAGSCPGAKEKGKLGKIEMADRGTLFINEIGDLPMKLQTKLFKVMKEHETQRVGSSDTKKIDVRIIAATERRIEKMINEKKFRLDLYYRLNVISLAIPALRERVGDIPAYCEYFIERSKIRFNKPVEGIDPEALKCLEEYQWPGNIGELIRVIERAVSIMEDDVLIKPEHLPVDIAGNGQSDELVNLKTVVEQAERETIIRYLHRFNDNKSQVAKILGLSRTALYDKIRKYNIKIAKIG